MKRALIGAAIALDLIAPRLAGRLANWLHAHAVDQALAYQRATQAHTHPAPDPTPPARPPTADAPHPTPIPRAPTTAERDADSSQQNP